MARVGARLMGKVGKGCRGDPTYPLGSRFGIGGGCPQSPAMAAIHMRVVAEKGENTLTHGPHRAATARTRTEADMWVRILVNG
jgi:hypothetical protein